MDGADSENGVSEPETLEKQPSLDVHISSSYITEHDDSISRGHTPGGGDGAPEPSMDNQRGKRQSMVRSVDGTP